MTTHPERRRINLPSGEVTSGIRHVSDDVDPEDAAKGKSLSGPTAGLAADSDNGPSERAPYPVMATTTALLSEIEARDAASELQSHDDGEAGGQDGPENASSRAFYIKAVADQLARRAANYGKRLYGLSNDDVQEIGAAAKQVISDASDVINRIKDKNPPYWEAGRNLLQSSVALSDTVQRSYGVTESELVESSLDELKKGYGRLSSDEPIGKDANFGPSIDIGQRSGELSAIAHGVIRQHSGKWGSEGIIDAANKLKEETEGLSNALHGQENRDRNFYERSSTSDVIQRSRDVMDRSNELLEAIQVSKLPRRYRGGTPVSNVIDGDRVSITHGDGSQDWGIVVGVEKPQPGEVYPEGTQYLIRADFGGSSPGRIPVVGGRLPRDTTHIRQE